MTLKNCYPLPLINKTLNRLVGAKWYTKLNLKDAYYYIQIQVGDKWKTAFYTYYSYFEY